MKEIGKICCDCGVPLESPHGFRPRTCAACVPRPHRVYMRFEHSLGVWRVSLTAMQGSDRLRDLTFADAAKVEAMVIRANGRRDLAATQALELALRNGIGGVELRLTDEQYRRLVQ